MSDGRTPHDDDPLGLGFGQDADSGADTGADGAAAAPRGEEPPPTEPLAAGDRPWTPAAGTAAQPGAGDDPFPWLSDAAGAGAGAHDPLSAPPPAAPEAPPAGSDDVTQVFGAVPPAAPPPAPPTQGATTVYPTGYEPAGAAAPATTRFDPNLFTPLASTGGDDDGGDDDSGPSKKPLLILGIVGGVLVLAIVGLLLVLFTSGGGDKGKDEAGEVSSKPSTSRSASTSASPSKSASASPSATPSEAPSSAPPTTAPPTQAPAAPVITSFTANPTQVVCAAASGTTDVQLSWGVRNSEYVSIDGAEPRPASEGGRQVGFDCSKPSQTYTLTAYAIGGSATVQKTVTVTGTVSAPPSDPADPGAGTGGTTTG
ncbi:hypothetical protein [Schumannella sp. 10F1B-5-1]|uniref:hypothetical protein n=1 Tax=Schumannella sp. 10F1B-5-1 TaxID=2590780 RepID=UPI0015E84435|nr:hypothetical protein [Schumannella sp. 10F1B-5-1]